MSIDNLLDTNAAAALIGFSPATLKNARNLGTLAGCEPPPYIKMGVVCRYRRSELDLWLRQFVSQRKTKPVKSSHNSRKEKSQ